MAVALNCGVAPTPGAVPVTETDVTVGAAGVGVGIVGVDVEDEAEPHAQIAKVRKTALRLETIHRDIEADHRQNSSVLNFAPTPATITVMLELLIVVVRAVTLALRGHRELVLETSRCGNNWRPTTERRDA